MEIKKEEMKNINGGVISSAVLNAITKAVNDLFELGKHTGSSIRRLIKGKYCSIS